MLNGVCWKKFYVLKKGLKEFKLDTAKSLLQNLTSVLESLAISCFQRLTGTILHKITSA